MKGRGRVSIASMGGQHSGGAYPKPSSTPSLPCIVHNARQGSGKLDHGGGMVALKSRTVLSNEPSAPVPSEEKITGTSVG